MIAITRNRNRPLIDNTKHRHNNIPPGSSHLIKKTSLLGAGALASGALAYSIYHFKIMQKVQEQINLNLTSLDSSNSSFDLYPKLVLAAVGLGTFLGARKLIIFLKKYCQSRDIKIQNEKKATPSPSLLTPQNVNESSLKSPTVEDRPSSDSGFQLEVFDEGALLLAIKACKSSDEFDEIEKILSTISDSPHLTKGVSIKQLLLRIIKEDGNTSSIHMLNKYKEVAEKESHRHWADVLLDLIFSGKCGIKKINSEEFVQQMMNQDKFIESEVFGGIYCEILKSASLGINSIKDLNLFDSKVLLKFEELDMRDHTFKKSIQETLQILQLSKDQGSFEQLEILGPNFIEYVLKNEFVPDQTAPWENYIVRVDGWSKSYSDCSQHEYGSHMHHAVNTISSYFMEYPNLFNDLNYLLTACAYFRKEIGYKLKHPEPSLIGTMRMPSTSSINRVGLWATKLQGAYSSISDKYNGYQTKTSPYLEHISNSLNDHYFQIIQEANQTKWRLSTIQINSQGPGLYSRDPILYHVLPDTSKKILDFLSESVYPSILSEKTPDHLLEKLGELFWWLCHAKPWRLGDPSIAELAIKVCIRRSGLKLSIGPWKKGVIPWVEAMNQPDVKEFGKNFHALFDTVSTD